MNKLKRLFCKHNYKALENSYILLGWYECTKCKKQKYKGDNTEFTHFKIN